MNWKQLHSKQIEYSSSLTRFFFLHIYVGFHLFSLFVKEIILTKIKIGINGFRRTIVWQFSNVYTERIEASNIMSSNLCFIFYFNLVVINWHNMKKINSNVCFFFWFCKLNINLKLLKKIMQKLRRYYSRVNILWTK